MQKKKKNCKLQRTIDDGKEEVRQAFIYLLIQKKDKHSKI